MHRLGVGIVLVLLAQMSAWGLTINGYTRTSSNVPISGVKVTASNGGGSATTSSSGLYSITVSSGWTGVITPSKSEVVFAPVNRSYTSVTSNKYDQNFTGTPYVTISGAVLTSTSGAISNVTITASNGGDSTTTGSDGTYSLSVPSGWSGTVTPTKSNYTFNPTSTSYSNVTSNQTYKNFTGYPSVIITGTITTSSNTPLQSVTLTASNSGGTATTNSDGVYTLTVPYGWSGTVTPSKTGYGFSPASRSYTNVTTTQNSQYYTALLPQTISGYVRTSNNSGVANVTLTAGNSGGTATTDSNGDYSLTVPYNWSGTVTPAKTGCAFNPASKDYTNVTSAKIDQNYTALVPETISGTITTASGTAIAGVTVTANNSGGTATTDSYGNFSLTVPYNWTGTLTPAKTSYVFNPTSRSYTDLKIDQAGQNFTGYAPVTISGSVMTPLSQAIDNVTLTANNSGGTAATSASGTYSLTVPYGWSGTVTPSKTDYTFIPPSITYSNITSNQTNQNYRGYTPQTITGTIRTAAGVAVSGVTLTADDVEVTAATNANGVYTLEVPYDWSGNVTPSKTGCEFSPAVKAYTNVTAARSGQDYTAHLPQTITGTIKTSGGTAASGVTVTADNDGGTATTNAGGIYTLTVPYNWSGTVTPAKNDCSFEPEDKIYTNVTTEQLSQDYIAYLPVTIAGTVKTGSSAAISGVTIQTDDDRTTTTGTDGTYTLTVPYGWSGTVTPGKEQYVFDPVSKTYSSITSNKTAQNYTGYLPIAISGYIRTSGGIAISGVSVTADGDGTSATTNSSGAYTVSVPYGWSGSVTPSKTDYVFEPARLDYTGVTTTQTSKDYVGHPPLTISGTILSLSGTAVAGVTVTADNDGGTAATDANGDYAVTVPWHWSGTITPAKAAYTFDPTGKSYNTLSANQIGQDYRSFLPITISGYVATADGIAIEGADIFTSDAVDTTRTDSTGFYSLSVSEGWSGSVRVYQFGCIIDPASTSYTHVTADLTYRNFTATTLPIISGHIRNADNAGIFGVTVTADNGGGLAATDGMGYYRIAVPSGWSGRITPTRNGYTFDSVFEDYMNVTESSADQDYTGTPSNMGVIAWGDDASGQTEEPAPNEAFVAVAAGDRHTLGLKTDGSIIAWGDNDFLQCSVPVEPNLVFTTVSAGRNHNLAVSKDGSIYAWGDNTEGQCMIPEPNSLFVAVAAGGQHSLGLKADGFAVAWGNNDENQCSVPDPNSHFVAIAAGNLHSLGLRSDGTVVAWGSNDHDQCTVPTPNEDFAAIAAGGAHSLGLKSDGTVVAWGDDSAGQCTIPAPNADFVAIAASGSHSLGLKANGSLVAWGDNTSGQSTIPAPNANFISMAAGSQHSIAVKLVSNFHQDTLFADINADFVVDFQDFLILAGQWGKMNCTGLKPCMGADLRPDGKVGIDDLNILAEDWLKKTDIPMF